MSATQKPVSSEDILGQKDGHGPSRYPLALERERPGLTATAHSTPPESPAHASSPNQKLHQANKRVSRSM
ncbi:hypothetical protein JR316_0013024 [Psilocybe cubensis]|uniref:Uncharacterized protein n=1 Tax=Psilocybe cubensis TaxID=181762 RepID=A0ACB8GGT0_PSICU|nr:hypothetical protein JR316_0013024 [Psilocybe cubensis]KAH9474562.1 hypothetical protein JR316_0013024 [Psilocybe cubensis]